LVNICVSQTFYDGRHLSEKHLRGGEHVAALSLSLPKEVIHLSLIREQTPACSKWLEKLKMFLPSNCLLLILYRKLQPLQQSWQSM